MKKVYRIILYVIGILFVLALLLVLFRNEIITYSLKKIIDNRSQGSVELSIKSFHLDITNGDIVIKGPELQFSDLFLNKQENIRINRIDFEKIEINRLDLIALIIHGDILADRFTVVRPEFLITERGNRSTSSFHPEKLIRTLNQNPNIFSRIRIRISNVEIQYGAIKLSERNIPEIDQGLVDFTILLDHFDTHPDTLPAGKRILYSDEFRLKLKNLHKELSSGYLLNIDSAVFSSNHRDLIINGVSLFPGERIADKNNIGIKAGKLAFNNIGLNEVRGLDDLNLRSVEISDGSFYNFVNEESGKNKEPEQAKGVNQLIKILYDFTLDTAAVHHFNFYNIVKRKDTTVAAERINFLMTGLKIDSAMISDLFWHLHYTEIRFNTGHLALRNIIPGFSVDYDSLEYATNKHSLQIGHVHVKSDTVVPGQSGTNFLIPWLNIKGLSLKDLQKRKKQHLTVSFVHPGGELDIAQLPASDKPGNGKFLFPGYLFLDTIEITDGNFHVFEEHKLELAVSKFNLKLTGLHLPETTNDSVRIKHVFVAYNGLNLQLDGNSFHLVTGPMDYARGNMLLHDVTWKQNTPGHNSRLHLNAVNFRGLDRESLMYQQKLFMDSLMVMEPDFSGSFAEGNSGDRKQKQEGKGIIPFAVQINHIVLKNGKLNNTFALKGKPAKIKSNYNLELEGLVVSEYDSLRSILNRLNWKFESDGLEACIAGHRIRVRSLLSDTYLSGFFVKGLDVQPEAGNEEDTNSIIVRTLTIPSVGVTGLDYGLLIRDDSIIFHNLRIEQPNINVILPGKKDTLVKKEQKFLFRPDDYLIFGYDTIELSRLNLKIEKKSRDKNETVKLEEFYFSHFKNIKNPDNLVDDLIVHFEELQLYDSISGHYLRINQGALDSGEKTLHIKGISGSNLASVRDEDKVVDKQGVRFNSREIVLSGLTISEKLPSHIRARKMEADDISLDIFRKTPDSTVREEFKVNLNIMKKLENLVTGLQLDTAVLNNAGFNIYTIGDTVGGSIRVDSIGVVLEKLKVDTSMSDRLKPEIINRITIDLKGNTQITKDSLYEFRTGKLHYNFRDRKITIDSFYIKPLFEPEEFFRRARYQTDRIDFFGRKLEIDDINLDELLSNNHLHVSDIHLYQARAEMYRDKHYPIRPGIYKPMPRELLMSINKAFTIDSVHIVDAYLKYMEMDAKADEPGEVFFDQFNVTAYNLTNKINSGEKKELKINLDARIMGQSSMSLNFDFPLNPDTVTFRMTGRTEKIDLTTLNPLTKNLLGIGIVKGHGRVDISNITGNDSVATGDLVFRYKKLRLLPYNRKKEKLRKGVLSPLISFMINDLVVKSNNPKFARKPRVGEVYFKRDTQKSIVNYVWKSVLSGLMTTLGFNNKALKQERKEEKRNN